MPLERSVKIFFVIIIVFALMIGGFYGLLEGKKETLPEGDLANFSSMQQMRSFLEERRSNGNDMLDQRALGTIREATSGYHSETNVQVAGVDELDTIKTDGTNIYSASYDHISITRALPVDELINIANIDIGTMIDNSTEHGNIEGIFLNEHTLIAIVSIGQYYGGPSMMLDMFRYMPITERTEIFEFDVSDPSSPLLVNDLAISGYSIGSRMIGDIIYQFTSQSVWLQGDMQFPTLWKSAIEGKVPIGNIRFDPNATSIDAFTNILAFDISTHESNASSLITGISSTFYVSQNNIYLSCVDRQVSNDVSGRDIAIASIGGNDPITTSIYKVAMDDLDIIPQSKGKVEGFLLNQFSLDEWNGTLRVATCSGWTEQDSSVIVLDDDMNQIGSLRGLAHNESIQAARFMGDLLYLVTFQVIDPLFIIDLSDPTQPLVLSELIMPGFSSYLHPIDQGRLIGIGTENGSLKVSLYDVSNRSDPTILKDLRTDIWTWSEAQWDHKSVLFDPRYDLLVIPVYSYDAQNWYGQQQVFVYSINETGMQLLAKLNNGENESSARCVVVDDVLYTVTSNSIVSWNLASMEQMDRLAFEGYHPYDPWPSSSGIDMGAVGQGT
jgi:inhibitor of cysteine peptidase